MGKPTQAQMRFCLSCSVGLSEQVRGLHTLADQFSHARIGFGQDGVDEAEEGLMVDDGEKFFDVGLDAEGSRSLSNGSSISFKRLRWTIRLRGWHCSTIRVPPFGLGTAKAWVGSGW